MCPFLAPEQGGVSLFSEAPITYAMYFVVQVVVINNSNNIGVSARL